MDKKIYDQNFKWSPISIQQDMAMLMNASKYSCDLEPVYESPQEFNYRQSIWTTKRKGATSSLTIGLIAGGACILLPLLLVLFIDAEMLSEHGDELISSLLTVGIALFLSVSIRHAINTSGVSKRYSLKIDSNNCKNFQIRVLTDNKIYIICNPNFNKDNQLIDSNCIAEVPYRYSDLIVLDYIKAFEENDAGIHIRADATVRAYDEERGMMSYQQNNNPVDIDIYVQKGIYPIQLLQCCSQTYPIQNMVTGPRYRYLISTIPPQNKPVWHVDFPTDDTPGLEFCKHFYCHDRTIKSDRFTQYFKNEYGQFFKIEFIKAITNSDDLFESVEQLTQRDLEKVVDKKWGYYYVKRYMTSYGDCSIHGQGEALVVPLPDFTLVEVGKRFNTYTYTEDGSIKTIRISNGFIGLAEEFMPVNQTI